MTTLARLSLWGPSNDRLDDLAAEYERRLRPCLAVHGLDDPLGPGDRPALGRVYNQLFALENPAQVPRLQAALDHDETLQGHLAEIGQSLAPWRDGAPLVCHFGHYSTPSGPGQIVELGPGQRRGDWRTFSCAEGLPSPTVRALAADPEGRLWIGTNDGLACLDGARLRFFTAADGLPCNEVWSLAVDQRGHVWVGTALDDGGRPGLGLGHFDGQCWTTHTRVDGLPSNLVGILCLDPQGRLWVAGQGQVGYWDGTHWTAWPAAGGLPLAGVSSLLADSRGRIWLSAYQVEAGAPGLAWWGPSRALRAGSPTSSTKTARGASGRPVARPCTIPRTRTGWPLWGSPCARANPGPWPRMAPAGCGWPPTPTA